MILMYIGGIKGEKERERGGGGGGRGIRSLDEWGLWILICIV